MLKYYFQIYILPKQTNEAVIYLINHFTFSAFLSYLHIFSSAIYHANGVDNKDRTGAGSTISIDSALGSDYIALIPISRTTTNAKQSGAFPYFEYITMSWMRKTRSVITTESKITYSILNISFCKKLYNYTEILYILSRAFSKVRTFM